MMRVKTSKIREKKQYVWQLAAFLHMHKMTMSGEELAQHLNRNKFLAGTGGIYKGGRGTYTLIRETWNWLHDELHFHQEARKVAEAYVKPDGSFAYK